MSYEMKPDMSPEDFKACVDNYFAAVEKVKADQPGNRCAKHLKREVWDKYTQEQQYTLFCCTRTGIDNPDSGTGAYAMKPDDYETFKDFFDPLIRDYHGAGPDAVHINDWDASDVGENGVLDVTKLGLEELSMRVRVGRNLKQFNLPGLMDKDERIKFEINANAAFEKLIANESFGGQLYSISPDWGTDDSGAVIENKNKISDEKYNELVKSHVMFKDMDADVYLKSAGISSDWPYGRGCYQSADKACIVWFGEEDHFRIMCMKTGARLDEVFSRLKVLLDTIESIEGMNFAVSPTYGVVTSCPTNLGTGMRASVHVKIPNLTKDGTDTKAIAVASPLGLSVRGLGGEHTPIGADGTVDISPRARLFIKEKEIIAALYKGIELLMAEEKAAA